MAKIIINSGLMSAVIVWENEYGVPRLDFSAHNGTVQGLPVAQSKASPFDVKDKHNSENVSTVNGRQLSDKKSRRLSSHDVTGTFSHAVGLNDIINIVKMFLQHYGFEDLLFDTTVSAVANSTTASTLTVADASNMEVDSIINLGGRSDSDEDGEYFITAISGNDITIDGLLDDTDIGGTVKSIVAVHTLKLEDPDDPLSSYLEKSSTVHLPDRFPRETTASPGGEIATGVIGTKVTFNFMDASYTAEVIAKNLDDNQVNNPSVDVDYKEPTQDDGYFRTTFGAMDIWDADAGEWIEQETVGLTLTIEFSVTTDARARKAGNMNRVIVDGVKISGEYEAPLLTGVEVSNYASQFYANRDIIGNEGKVRLRISQGTGEMFAFEGFIVFVNPERAKQEGGNTVKLPFEMEYDSTNGREAVKAVFHNTYLESIKSYL